MTRREWRNHRHHGHGGIFLGAVLLLGGGAVLLGRAGHLPVVPLWQLWPVLLLAKGASRLLAPGVPSGRRLGGVLWVALGVFFAAVSFGMLPLDWETLWPGLLVALGALVLGRSLLGPRRVAPGCKEAVVRTPGSPELVVDLTFGGASESFEGRDFSGGSVRCRGGGYELDLRGARMLGDSATIELDVGLGGVELRVPRTWRVEVDVETSLGAVENQASFLPDPDARSLRLVGRVFMGGVEVRN
jgi:hypothetical protein